MAIIIIILLIVILSIIIIWPWSILIIVIIALYPLGLIIKHKFGHFVPHWSFGDDPTSEIYLYFKSEKENLMKLRYQNKKQDNWNEINEIKILKSELNTPKIDYQIKSGKKTPRINNQKTLNHYFLVDKLERNSKFRYEIIISDNKKRIAKGEFYTQPLKNEKEFKFAVFGDYQMAENLEIIETYFTYLIRKENPSLLITLGDNVHKYDDMHSWKVFHTLLRKIIPNIPLYTTPGNHDYGNHGNNGKSISLDAMMFPINNNGNWCYSFKFGNIQFISMLSLLFIKNDRIEQSKIFLRNELIKAQSMKETGEIDWIIFFTHVPWWGPQYNDKNSMDKAEKDIIDNWIPIFDEFHVDLYFSGHKHSYCRDKNRIITGSMHGVRKYQESSEKNYFLRNSHQYCLVKSSKNQLVVESRTWGNRILDSYTLEKGLDI